MTANVILVRCVLLVVARIWVEFVFVGRAMPDLVRTALRRSSRLRKLNIEQYYQSPASRKIQLHENPSLHHFNLCAAALDWNTLTLKSLRSISIETSDTISIPTPLQFYAMLYNSPTITSLVLSNINAVAGVWSNVVSATGVAM